MSNSINVHVSGVHKERPRGNQHVGTAVKSPLGQVHTQLFSLQERASKGTMSFLTPTAGHSTASEPAKMFVYFCRLPAKTIATSCLGLKSFKEKQIL